MFEGEDEMSDSEKRKLEKLRDKYRSTICAGCRNNRYNYKSDGNGIDAPTTGEGCWSLTSIKRGKCPLKG